MSTELNKYYRVPKINVNLPSLGKFYKPGFLDASMDGSLPVRAMTARDELMLKSPDALLNGDCLVHIIKSCVPAIENPKYLLAPDVEAVLLGIFFASYGPNLDFKSECPECKKENEFQVPIRGILDSMTHIEHPASVTLELGAVEGIETKFVVHVQPYTFETNTKHQLSVFEHNKMLQVLAKDDIDDEKKLAMFNSCFEKIVTLKFENVVKCITQIDVIETVNGEEVCKHITDLEEIQSFVFNAEKSMVDPIVKRVDELNVTGINSDFTAECSACNHTWTTKVEFNPVNFFVSGSNRSGLLK